MPAPSYKGDSPYIFVSYAHSEMDVVGAEIDRLSASGVNVWYDEGISPGQEWSEELGHAITGASCFVFFVSANSTTSKHCRNELQLAINRNVPVIAVHLEETQLSDGLELSLGATQAIFKHQLDEPTYREKLAEAIGSVSPVPSTGTPSTPPRKRLGASMIASAAVLVLALGALGWWASDRPVNDSRPDLGTQETSIAVLPFANLSADPANRFFAAGVHEDILTELSRMSDLIVISRSSVMQYQDQTVNIKDVGKDMNVTHVLEGSARQIGNLVRVTVQLIEAATDQHIWAESFDGELTDIFRLQNEIAFSVANQLSIKLSDDYRGERRGDVPTESFEAYSLYKRAVPRTDQLGIDLIEQALAIDPNYAAAHATLSTKLRATPDWLAVRERAEASARKAVELAPNYGYGHWNLAEVMFRIQDPAAIDHLLRGVELEPNNVFMLDTLGRHHLFNGRTFEALKVFERIQRRQPDVPNAWLTTVHLAATGERTNLAAHAERLAAIGVPFGPYQAAAWYSALGDHVRELEMYSKVRNLYNPWWSAAPLNVPSHIVFALLAIGELEYAHRWISWMETNQRGDPVLVALRTAWFHARQDAEGLADYNVLLTDLLPAEYQFMIDRPGLARLRARLSDSVDERQSLLRTAHELSLARTQAYQASSTGFVADRWAVLTFAAENLAFGDAQAVAPGIIDGFKNGGFAWFVDHKYANLALCHAISGDLDEAMKQMRLAVDYGFNELFRFEQMNVFDDHQGVFNGLGELPEFQSLIEQVRARNAELRTHVRENMPELSDPEWVATSSAG